MDYMESDNSSLFSLDDNVTDLGNATGIIVQENEYCGPTWTRVGEGYSLVHGYFALIICLFGCVLNLLNLVVLTRKEMHNPTNVILTGLAFADLLNDLEYMPFALFMKVLAQPGYPPKTYPWALFVLAHSNFSQVCHTISIWLTVTLAVWRYMMVAMPMQNRTLCTMERAKLAVGIAYVCSLIVCIPMYLTFSIKSGIPKDNSDNATATVKYFVYYSELAELGDQLLVKAIFWIYSVVIKIIPCILLTVVSLRLINSLMAAKRRKEQLKGRRTKGEEGGGGDRTTRMLLAVLGLFLITEFPQGILGLLSGLLGNSFFRNCYMPLGDIMDQVALSNSAINFILYCAMSLKFRSTFITTFHLSGICPQQATVGAAEVSKVGVSTITTNGNPNAFQQDP